MLGSKDKFAMMGEVINYRPEPQDIYVQFDLEWVEGKVGADISKGTLSATGKNPPLTSQGRDTDMNRLHDLHRWPQIRRRLSQRRRKK